MAKKNKNITTTTSLVTANKAAKESGMEPAEMKLYKVVMVVFAVDGTPLAVATDPSAPAVTYQLHRLAGKKLSSLVLLKITSEYTKFERLEIRND